MIVQESVADAGVAAPPGDAVEATNPWQSRPGEELRAIIGRGAHGGEAYFSAIKELERRAHDSEIALEEQQTTAVARGREISLTVAILFAAIVFAAIALMLGY
jgi:hypothetical protein